MSLKQGLDAEEIACRHLLGQGLELVSRNFRSRFGEIDLIFTQASLLIFVEVRQRTSDTFGGALASVTKQKQQKIIRTAEYFLLEQPKFRKKSGRFDVVAFEGAPPVLQWVKNAFGQ